MRRWNKQKEFLRKGRGLSIYVLSDGDKNRKFDFQTEQSSTLTVSIAQTTTQTSKSSATIAPRTLSVNSCSVCDAKGSPILFETSDRLHGVPETIGTDAAYVVERYFKT